MVWKTLLFGRRCAVAALLTIVVGGVVAAFSSPQETLSCQDRGCWQRWRRSRLFSSSVIVIFVVVVAVVIAVIDAVIVVIVLALMLIFLCHGEVVSSQEFSSSRDGACVDAR